MVMYLHPCKAKSPTDAILRELSSLLFTSDEVVLHISGSLTADSSECARRLDKWSLTDSTSKKRKVNEGIKNPEGDRLMINKKIIGEDEMPEEGMTMVKRKQLYGKMTSSQIKRSKKGRKNQS